MRRNRWVYALAIAVVIAAGLASRSSLATHIPPFIAAYAGDTLWALTVFLALGFLLRSLRPLPLAAIAIVIAFSIEFSQLYQADWLNKIRSTHVGALLLGAGFKWSDLLCYTTGVVIGVAAESLITSQRMRPEPQHTPEAYSRKAEDGLTGNAQE